MFVAVKFQPGDARTYTYFYAGDCPVEVGDFCIVETRHGRKAVEVAAVDCDTPSFECEPILAILTEKVA